VQIPIWAWKKTGGRFIGSKADSPALDEIDVNGGDEKDPAILNATAPNPIGEAKRRRAKARQRS
jgi:hypothetical protein